VNNNGMAVRREVLGPEYVDRALARDDEISRDFQAFITEYCWGAIWTDERLPRRERSLLVLGMTAALGRMNEFEAHARGALRNGVTPDELSATLRQITVYCGVPAGVNCAAALRAVLAEEPKANGSAPPEPTGA
jgi:4-carboxymuconolactone decarboxylase